MNNAGEETNARRWMKGEPAREKSQHAMAQANQRCLGQHI